MSSGLDAIPNIDHCQQLVLSYVILNHVVLHSALDDGDDQPFSKRVRLAIYRRTNIIPAAAISKSNVKSPSEGSGKGKHVHKIDSIADQSLRLRMEIVKELDSGVDIDLKGIGFVETTKTSKRSETSAK